MAQLLLAVLLFTRIHPAQQTSQTPPEQQIAHVISAATHKSHHSTSVYNSQTGQYSHGGGTSVERETEIQIGNLIYESSQVHKQIKVGKDYPVVVETDKSGAVKKLTLTLGEKTYTYKVTGIREAILK